MKTYKTEIISILSGLTLLSLLAFASSAYSGPGPRGDFAGPGFAIERMVERYGLDETQRQQIENIFLAAKPEFEALRARVKAEVEAVLTDEQLAQMQADKERMKQRLDEAAERRLGLH